jgi:hypothetical protein
MNEEKNTFCPDTSITDQEKKIQYKPLFPIYENPKLKTAKYIFCVNVIYAVCLLSIVYSHYQEGIDFGFMIDVPFEILIATGMRQFVLWIPNKGAIRHSEKYGPQEIIRNKKKTQ